MSLCLGHDGSYQKGMHGEPGQRRQCCCVVWAAAASVCVGRLEGPRRGSETSLWGTAAIVMRRLGYPGSHGLSHGSYWCLDSLKLLLWRICLPTCTCACPRLVHADVSCASCAHALQNPHKAVAKNHHQIVLRAESAAEKYDWLARLRQASEANAGARARITQSQSRSTDHEKEPEKEKVSWEGRSGDS